MMLFGPRYKGLLKDIYQHGVLARDFSLYLHHPTVTDPSLAPEGHSTFYALAQVPHLGKLPIDWGQMGPVYKERILDEIARRLIPDIRSRIVTSFPRPEARRVGKEGVSTCSSRWRDYHIKK